MTEDACLLASEEQRAVETQIAETCACRGWTLYAVNCRTNHVHVAVTADVADPRKVRIDLKAWATRTLKSKFDSRRENWWAERGSIRWLNTDDESHRVMADVRDAQDGDRCQPEASARRGSRTSAKPSRQRGQAPDPR